MADMVEQVLPIRLFGQRSFSSRGGSSSALIRTGGGGYTGAGATSLLSHVLSRASLRVARPPAAAMDVDDEDEEEYSRSGSQLSTSRTSSSSASSSDMWHAWDESCDPQMRRGRGGERWEVGPWDTSSSSAASGGLPSFASSTAAGAGTFAPSSAAGVGRANGAYHRSASGGFGVGERLERCTPPSMHQLRYHLKVSYDLID